MSPLRCRLRPAHIDVTHVVVKRAPPTSRHGLFVRVYPDGTIAELLLHHPTGTMRMLFDIGEVLARFEDEIVYVDGTTAVATGDGLPERSPLPPGFNFAEWLQARLLAMLTLAEEVAAGTRAP
jgi:hypothetical protein